MSWEWGMFFSSLLIFPAGMAYGALVARKVISEQANKQISEYKARWKKAVELLQADEKISDDQLKLLIAAPEGGEEKTVNGWVIETYRRPGHYLDKPNSSLDFIAIRMKKSGESIDIRPHRDQIGLDPSLNNFAAEMAEYRRKAVEAARLM